MSAVSERSTVRALAIVPARLGSQRLPRKMLLAETGLPLFVHTARNLARCTALARVIVAVDDESLLAAAAEFGITAAMTRVDHASGTDRVHEVARTAAREFDVVINVQGDEPELHLPDLERLVATFIDPSVEAATLCGRFESLEQTLLPQVVKVVRDQRGDALYFSRAVIPHRSTDPARSYARSDAPPWESCVRRHIGVYGFRPAALDRFVRTPRGALEGLENLEQLRWLEAGNKMRVIEAEHVPLGIDTRADYDAFVARVKASGASFEGRSAR